MSRLSMPCAAALVLCLATPAFAKATPPHRFSYKVKQGDTLECLARYHVHPQELSALNGGKPDVRSFKLVAGRTIITPISLPPDACAGSAAKGRGAKPPLGEQACARIDKTKHLTVGAAHALLEKLVHSKACMLAIELAANENVDALCQSVGQILNAHQGLGEGIEFLCTSAHLFAHQVHGTHQAPRRATEAAHKAHEQVEKASE